MRDDFSAKTIEILGKRVAYLCSNPDCQKPTIGPHTDSMKATIIGVAAHITAAAANGPRYNENLTPDERSDISNGIWLCENCATLIDKDEKHFPKELLETWKKNAEEEAFQAIQVLTKEKLSKSTTTTTTRAPDHIDIRPFAEADIHFVYSNKRNLGPSRKNQLGSSVPLHAEEAIWHNKIDWHYILKIYNNSTAPIFNLRATIKNNPKELKHLEEMPQVNYVLPLDAVSLHIDFENYYHSTGEESVEIQNNTFPKKFDELQILLEYSDEYRNIYKTNVFFKNGEIMNEHA